LTPDQVVVSIVRGGFAFAGLVVSSVWADLRFRLEKRELELSSGSLELGREVDALREGLRDTRAQLAEMQERLGFAELVLTAGREGRRPGGR
jgi:hypothetical protein